MLVEAGALQRRTVTSWPSLRTDIRNAGAEWVDRQVVSDNGLVTSRKPDDIPAFNREMIAAFSQSGHKKQSGQERSSTLTGLAGQLDNDAQGAADAAKVRLLASTVRQLAGSQ